MALLQREVQFSHQNLSLRPRLFARDGAKVPSRHLFPDRLWLMGTRTHLTKTYTTETHRYHAPARPMHPLAPFPLAIAQSNHTPLLSPTSHPENHWSPRPHSISFHMLLHLSPRTQLFPRCPCCAPYLEVCCCDLTKPVWEDAPMPEVSAVLPDVVMPYHHAQDFQQQDSPTAHLLLLFSHSVSVVAPPAMSSPDTAVTG